MEQLKLQMRLLPLHMGAATAPSIPHALQMELLNPKLFLFLGKWGYCPFKFTPSQFQMAVWPPYITKSLLPFFLPSLLNEPTILDFGQGPINTCTESAFYFHSLLPFFLPSLLNEPTILDFGQGPINTCTESAFYFHPIYSTNFLI
jgi:hypothetical protein